MYICISYIYVYIHTYSIFFFEAHAILFFTFYMIPSFSMKTEDIGLLLCLPFYPQAKIFYNSGLK